MYVLSKHVSTFLRKGRGWQPAAALCSSWLATYMHIYIWCRYINEKPNSIIFYSYVFIARTLLAAIDHNCHIHRNILKSADGEEQYDRRWSRRTKEWNVVARKEKKTYGYIIDIQVV